MRSGFPVQFTLKNVFPVPSAYEKMAENISRISHASILTIPVIFDDSGSAQYQGGLSLQQNSHLQQKAKRRLYVLTNDRPGNKVVTNDLQREPDDSTTEKNNISLAEGMVAKLGALGIAAELKVQDTGVGTVFQSDRAAMPAYSIVIKMGEATPEFLKKLASVAPADLGIEVSDKAFTIDSLNLEDKEKLVNALKGHQHWKDFMYQVRVGSQKYVAIFNDDNQLQLLSFAELKITNFSELKGKQSEILKRAHRTPPAMFLLNAVISLVAKKVNKPVNNAHLPEQITDRDQFNAHFLTAVRQQALGLDTGAASIDAQQRLDIVKKYPEFVEKKNAGNAVILIKNAVLPKGSKYKDDQNTFTRLLTKHVGASRLQNVLTIFNQEFLLAYDRNNAARGLKTGTGNIGGIGASGDDPSGAKRSFALKKNLKLKWGGILKANGIDEQQIKAFEAYVDQLTGAATFSDIEDIRFLTHQVLPDRQSLLRLKALNLITDEVFTFYQNFQGLDHVAIDMNTLGMVVSNTYLFRLDQAVFPYLAYEKSSAVFNGLQFRLDIKPLLSGVLPQEFSYLHEFYAGLLPSIMHLLKENGMGKPEFIGVLKACVENAIVKMQKDIHDGLFPEELKDMKEAQKVYRCWMRAITINFSQFLQEYKGYDYSGILKQMELTSQDLMQIDSELMAVWSSYEKDIVAAIQAKLSPADNGHEEDELLYADLDPSEAAELKKIMAESKSESCITYVPSMVANAALKQTVKSDEDSHALLTDPISYVLLDDPVIAADGQSYSRGTYQSLTNSPTNPELSFIGIQPWTYSALSNLIGEGSYTKENLILLIVDPYTKEVMKDPRIFYRVLNNQVDVVIADKSSGNKIVAKSGEPNYSSREFEDLKAFIEQIALPIVQAEGDVNEPLIQEVIAKIQTAFGAAMMGGKDTAEISLSENFSKTDSDALIARVSSYKIKCRIEENKLVLFGFPQSAVASTVTTAPTLNPNQLFQTPGSPTTSSDIPKEVCLGDLRLKTEESITVLFPEDNAEEAFTLVMALRGNKITAGFSQGAGVDGMVRVTVPKSDWPKVEKYLEEQQQAFASQPRV